MTPRIESTAAEEGGEEVEKVEGYEDDSMRNDGTTSFSSNEDTTELKLESSVQNASIGMFTRNNEDSTSNYQEAVIEVSTQKLKDNDIKMSITHFDGEEYSFEEAEGGQKDTTSFENGSGYDYNEENQYQFAAGDYIETSNEPKKSKKKKTANLITRVKRQAGKPNTSKFCIHVNYFQTRQSIFGLRLYDSDFNP